jgi:hypothetical protein
LWHVPFVSAVIAQREIIRRFPTTSAGGWCSVSRLTQAPGTKTTNLNYFLMLSGLTERFALSEGLSRRYRFRPERGLTATITVPRIFDATAPGQPAQVTARVAVTTLAAPISRGRSANYLEKRRTEFHYLESIRPITDFRPRRCQGGNP